MNELSKYVQETWRCRYFWLSLVHVDLRARYRGSAFGIGWSLLHPIAMTTILCVVFSTMFHLAITDHGPYLMTGLIYWQFVTGSALAGCSCFFTAETYIRQHPAPMAIYPLRTMLGAAFHFGMGFLLAIGLTLLFHGAGHIGFVAYLSLIPSFVLVLTFGWALAVLFGLATVRFRDLKHISEVGFQALFYLTPIMYPAEQVAQLLERRTVGWLFRLNPFVPFLDLLREPICHGVGPSPWVYLSAGLITLVTVVAAVLALKVEERSIIFQL